MTILFMCGLGTETNSFSPIPTTEQDFLQVDGGPAMFFGTPLERIGKLAADAGWTVKRGLTRFAAPAGPTTRKAYETLRDRLLAELSAALPVDAVFVNMHGAMIADGYDDCEGDLLGRVRAIVGPDVVIGGELDPHCNFSAAMMQAADILIAYKEYPHTDVAERADEVFELMRRTADGEIRPVMSLHDCRMIGIYHTPKEPMRSFVDRMSAAEGKGKVLSVSAVHGFPWSDVPDAGTKILVITDDAKAEGDALAAELGEALRAIRGQTAPVYEPLNAILDRLDTLTKPVVAADASDNTGGGAPGDSTFLLEDLIARDTPSVLGMLYDPMAAKLALGVGAGARLKMRLGGKTGPESGRPLDLEVEVLAAEADYEVEFFGRKSRIGPAAALKIGNVRVVVISERIQTGAPGAFTGLGIDLAGLDVIVVKSSQHFYAAFAPIAGVVLYTASPGTLNSDLPTVPYQRLTRPNGRSTGTHRMRVIDAAEIARLMPMADAIECVDKVMRTVSARGVNQPNRFVIPLGGGNGMGVMPGQLFDPPVHGMKLLSLYPGNPARGLSSHQGVMIIFDTATGTPLASLDASTLTALRTAAASAVGTRALARDDARVLTIFGAGEQAEWHLKAVPLVRRFDEIRIWSRSRDKAEALATHGAPGGARITVFDDARASVAGADVIVTTTSSKTPVLMGEWLEAGQHVTLVGASMADAREIDAEGVARASYFVDSRQSAAAQAGELIEAMKEGAVGDGHIRAEIGEVLAGTLAGRGSAGEITIYKSHGVAAQDLAVGHAIALRAGS